MQAFQKVVPEVRDIAMGNSHRRPRTLSHSASIKLGKFVALGMLMTISCIADSNDSVKNRRSSAPRRTWTEVKDETEAGFQACYDGINVIKENTMKGGWAGIGMRGNLGLFPDRSSMDVKVTRTTYDPPLHVFTSELRPPPIRTLILELHVERDYSYELGQASSFRIEPKIMRDEGRLIVMEIVKTFDQKKWPYKLILPKDNKPSNGTAGKKPDADNRTFPAR